MIKQFFRRLGSLPAPKFLVRMVHRGMASDCDKLARRLTLFGRTDEANQVRQWAMAFRQTADEI
jgi:hypothetical protein